MATVTGNPDQLPNEASASADWWKRIDAWCESIGDAVNPILVKETRQALKSRQFLVTFSMLLFASLAWTIAGSMMSMPQIYTTPSAPRMLIGYYVVLAIPLLLVVPLAAYRSLEIEIDDGTLELLSITALSPWQIVLGKLASATLQMALYFVALLPCVAYAYTLRGVDLPTTFLMIAILAVATLLLTILGLFFAPMARGRSGRIANMLALLIILVFSEYAIGAMVIYMLMEGNPMPAGLLMYAIISTVLLAIAIGHLLLTTTAAQLTPETENRSTPIRLSLLSLTMISVGVAAYGMQLGLDDDFSTAIFATFTMMLAAIWTVAGAMMVAESSTMTPRIRRELPSSFLARSALTWLTPGPATGLVFASSFAVALVAFVFVGHEALIELHPDTKWLVSDRHIVREFALLYAGYFVSFLVIVRVLVALIRLKSNPRVEVGLAAFIVVAILSALVPYAMAMHANDYRSFDYSRWQISNWAWTISEVDRRFQSGDEYIVVTAAAALFAVGLLAMPNTVLPRKIATPERVQEEKAIAKSAKAPV